MCQGEVKSAEMSCILPVNVVLMVVDGLDMSNCELHCDSPGSCEYMHTED